METNVFSQFRDWRRRRADQATPAEIERVATMRNDKTYADEAAWIVRALLYLTAAFCAWASYFYYRDYLGESFSPAFVAVFSIALPVSVELLKVKISHNVLRSVFFGWAFRSFWSLGYWSFLFLLACGAYWWSVSISTDGMEKFSAMKADQHLQADSLPSLLTIATADIDRQIADAQRNYDSAIATKWKGTTTYQAQKAAQSQSAAMLDLQGQRAQIVEATTTDYQEGKLKRSDKIDAWSAFVRRFGGYMELASALCVIALVFFERRLYALYAHQAPPAPPPHNGTRPAAGPQNPNRATAPPPAPNGAGQPQKFHFNLADHQTLFSTLRKSVPHIQRPVAQKITDAVSTDADAVLKLAKTRLQSHVANFRSRYHRPGTTAGSMQAIINEVGNKMQGRGFEPTPAVATDFWQYMTETIFPALSENKYPYEYENQFLNDLERFLPQTVEASAA